MRHPVRRPHAELVLHRAQYERLQMTIAERGDLESASNSDIYCRVKAGSKNATVSTTIKWVIDDGSEVKGPRPEKPTGDLLVELDDSGLREQLQTLKVALTQAESDKVQAEEAYKIQVSQNDSDVKTAQTQLDLKAIALSKYTGLAKEEVLKPETIARLKEEVSSANRNARRPAREIAAEDLKKYRTGDYLAALKDSLGQVETAEADLSQQEDREAWALRMVKKGYQTTKHAQAETDLKENYRLALNKVALALDVLVKYTKVQTLTQYLGDLEEARRGLDRVTAQARSKEVQARTDRDAKVTIWELGVAHCRDTEEEIKKCKIYAPHDGRVLYYLPEQARSGGGSQLSIVAQGEPVREGQKLMQLPDLGRMEVSIRIHEAVISHVHPAQSAVVRVEAVPGRLLRGRVETVATYAAAPSWSMPDVRAYPTRVVIEPEDVKGLELRPGMTAEVTIACDDARKPALAVPIDAIIRGNEIGPERRMFVMTPDGPEERPVHVGASNAEVAEITNGLEEGEEVVLNPNALLEDEVGHQ
jgi:multidrug resistance efflux pump